jgi:hypothetical protein
MRPSHVLSFLCAASAAFTLASPASAEPVEGSVGAKLAGGGNLWTTPSNVPFGYTGLGYAGDGGGIGYGIGAYGELRVIKFLGFETGVAYDRSNIWRNVTVNGTIGTRETFTMSNLRIPVLVKGILPLGFGRASLGIGPEFIVPLSASATAEVTSGGPLISTEIPTKTAGSTMLTTDLGMVIVIPGIKLEIPIDVRISKNLSQPDAWLERVAVDMTTGRYTVQAQSSWDFRMLAGVGMGF